MVSSVLNFDDDCEEGAEAENQRLKRYVVLVQAMFRSKQAQEDYMRMKLTHEEALEKKIAFFFLF
uniref:Uncharacterized protein n=1 Tax=Brassica oleracea TaxID=3712 RepID=A0A3P6FB19_BRAOL|nr:unnamed protein product [Brassica oleracea]